MRQYCKHINSIYRGFFYLLCVVSLMFAACTKPLHLPDVSGTGKIVLLGEMVAGDSVCIRAGQSIAVASGSSMSYTLPQQLGIQLTDSLANSDQLNSYNDQWTQILHTLPFSSPQIIKENTVYKLQAVHTQLGIANCTVRIPKPFIAKLIDTATVIVNGLNLLRIRVQIYDDGNSVNYYSIEGVKQLMKVDGIFNYNSTNYVISENRKLYDSLRKTGVSIKIALDTTALQQYARINIYTDDEKTENLKVGNAQSASRRILLSDKAINGQIYTLQVYLDKELFVSNDSLKGQVQIKIKSIPENYFQYLKSYELFLPAGSFNSIAQPINFEGNIKNGVGMVGGAYLIMFRYLFDRWE